MGSLPGSLFGSRLGSLLDHFWGRFWITFGPTPISTRNGRILEISRNSTFPEIRARASGSGPTHQNLSPDLRFWARAGRAAISIPTPSFYENHGIPENRGGYIHSIWKDFRDFQKFHFSGNPSPSLRISPRASESEPRPQNLGSGRAGRHIHTYPFVL